MSNPTERSVRSNLVLKHDAFSYQPVLTINPQIYVNGAYQSIDAIDPLWYHVKSQTESILGSLLPNNEVKKSFWSNKKHAEEVETALDTDLTKSISGLPINESQIQDTAALTTAARKVMPAITLSIDMSGTGQQLCSLVVPDFTMESTIGPKSFKLGTGQQLPAIVVSEFTENSRAVNSVLHDSEQLPSLVIPDSLEKKKAGNDSRKPTMTFDLDMKTKISKITADIDEIEKHMATELQAIGWRRLAHGSYQPVAREMVQSFVSELSQKKPDILQNMDLVKASNKLILSYLREDLKTLRGADSVSSLGASLGFGTLQQVTDDTIKDGGFDDSNDDDYLRVDTTITGEYHGEGRPITRSLAVPLGKSGSYYVKSVNGDASARGWYECV